MDLFVNIVVAIIAPLALLSLTYKNKMGFLLFLIIEVCYIYLGIRTSQYGIVVMAVAFFVFNIYGYFKWRKDERTVETLEYSRSISSEDN